MNLENMDHVSSHTKSAEGKEDYPRWLDHIRRRNDFESIELSMQISPHLENVSISLRIKGRRKRRRDEMKRGVGERYRHRRRLQVCIHVEIAPVEG
jgi:hypothetical protein